MVKLSFPCSESTLTDRYQTTIPENVRKFLGLGKRDKIVYNFLLDGRVVLSRHDQDQSDPVFENFLNFLTEDLTNNPENIKPISCDLVSRIQSLVAGVDLDLDAPLLEEDE